MSRNRMITLAIIAVVAIGAGVYLVYDNVLRGDDVAPLALPSSSPAAVATAAPTTSADPAASASADPGASTDPGTGGDGDVAGTWTVTTGSEAGYRVREQLANLPAESDAVGRTSDVTGSITLVAAGDGAQLTEGSIEIDTTTIASDEDRRDNRMRSEGLQTDQFPTATFVVTTPVDIPSAALTGTRDGRDPRRRPHAPRRHEVGRDPGPGSTRGWPDPGGRVADLPVGRLRYRRPERGRLHRLDRRRGRARIPGRLRKGLTAALGRRAAGQWLPPPSRRCLATNAAACARRSRFSLERIELT